MLVSVEGNTYLSVPVLGFGAENDEVGNGEERMPWLSAEHPIGDNSPFTRFLMGLDQALRDYRGWEESLPSQKVGSSRDPWNEDLFYRHLPGEPPVLTPEKVGPKELGDPNAALPDPQLDDRVAQLGLGKKPFDEPSVRALSPASWIVKQFRAVAGLLATLCLIPAIFRYLASQQRPAILPIPTKAKPGDPCGSDSRSDVIGR